MTQSSNIKQNASPNKAAIVIDRFGGIRPMAKKMDVAVTTVQGWKKRGSIPKRRWPQLMDVAKEYDVDLTDIVKDKANQNAAHQTASPPEDKVNSAGPLKAERQASRLNAEKTTSTLSASPRATRMRISVPDDNEGDIMEKWNEKLLEAQYKAIAKSTWITVFIVLSVLISVAVFLFPYNNEIRTIRENGDKIETLETQTEGLRDDVEALKKNGSSLSKLIPNDLGDRIATLQTEAKAAQQELGAVLQDAKQFKEAVLGVDVGSLSERVAKLERSLKTLTGSPALQRLSRRLDTLSKSMPGQIQMDQAVEDLNRALSKVETATDPVIAKTITEAQGNSEALGQTLQGVQNEDLKAAALLLGFNQFRSSLNRDNTPFEEDLILLMTLINEEDVALRNALVTLAPHAKSGVLTAHGLSEELRTVAGEVVTESLKGQEVSLQNKLKARLDNVLKVEKRGQLISGTQTQATLNDVQRFLDQDDLDQAIAAAERLSGPEAQTIKPWLSKAYAARDAQTLNKALEQTIQVTTTPAAGAF